jgi:hypothetical protein
MEAIHLVCGTGGPQLKRNPLGGPHQMRVWITSKACEWVFQIGVGRAPRRVPGLELLVLSQGRGRIT